MSAFVKKKCISVYQRLMELLFGKLARASIWMVAAGIAAGALGYVFQVLMGRMLVPAEFALFCAIMALFSILCAPLGTLLMLVSRKVSEYRAKNDAGSIIHFYYFVNLRTAVFGIGVIAVCFAFSTLLQSYLKAPNVTPIYLLGVMLFFTFLPSINSAFMQGMQNFKWFSVSSVLSVLLKIIFAVTLVWLGYGITGALLGISFSFVMIWLLSYYGLHSQLVRGRGKSFQTTHLSIKSALPVLVANVAFATMTQFDMVLVNYYFPSHEAGLYAAASVLGKAVLYLPGGIALALFPMVAENHAGNKGSAHLLMQALLLAALMCGAGAVFYYLFGEWLIRSLYGENYLGASEVLRYYGLAILPMALVMVTEHFLIAKGKVLFAYLFLVFAPLQLLAVYWYHTSLLMIVGIMAATNVLLCSVGFWLLWREFRPT